MIIQIRASTFLEYYPILVQNSDRLELQNKQITNEQINYVELNKQAIDNKSYSQKHRKSADKTTPCLISTIYRLETGKTKRLKLVQAN